MTAAAEFDITRLERARPTWRAWTADVLEGEPVPQRRWLVKDLIPASTVTLLSGDGGVGKSTLALQLCTSVVLGRPWIGRTVDAGRALYLSAEDDTSELHRRLNDLATFHGASFEEMAGLKVLDLTAGTETIFATAAGSDGALEWTDLWDQLESELRTWRPSLVVLDSLADFFGANENSRPQVRQFVSRLRTLAQQADATVLLLGHPSLSGMNSGSGTSGSTAWNNSVRSRLYLTKADADGDPDIRILKAMKANYAPSLSDLRLRRQGLGFDLEEGGEGRPTGAVARASVDRQFLDLLAAYDAAGRPVRHSTGHGYAPALFAKDPAAKGTTKKGFEEAMNRLFTAGEIKSLEEGPASRRSSRIVRVRSGGE